MTVIEHSRGFSAGGFHGFLYETCSVDYYKRASICRRAPTLLASIRRTSNKATASTFRITQEVQVRYNRTTAGFISSIDVPVCVSFCLSSCQLFFTAVFSHCRRRPWPEIDSRFPQAAFAQNFHFGTFGKSRHAMGATNATVFTTNMAHIEDIIKKRQDFSVTDR